MRFSLAKSDLKIVLPIAVLWIAVYALAFASQYLDEKRAKEINALVEKEVKEAAARKETLRAQREREFNALTPAEHLSAASEIWERSALPVTQSNLDELNLASRHLRAIPASVPESKQAAEVLQLVDGAARYQADVIHQQMAEQEAQAQAAALEAQRQRQQRQRDSDAQFYSYWSTTLRVDTDMDSFWLPDEERTCQTSPGADGRVAIVACNPEGTHKQHNIPVKFWGGVDRNTVSDWKCRREKDLFADQFVCRAID